MDIAARWSWGKSKTALILGATSGLLATLVFAALPVAHAESVNFSGSAVNCDANAVIYCGALTVPVLQTKYADSPSTQVIYSAFGISAPDITNLTTTAVAGVVTKSGEVIVNGQVVATNALTAGRENIAGSTPETVSGVTFYERPPSVSFLSNELDAFVAMNSTNQFMFAILASCGNPVIASPVAPPATPAPPAPKPVLPVPKPTPPAPTPKSTTTNVQKTVVVVAPVVQQQQQQQQTVIVQPPPAQVQTVVEQVPAPTSTTTAAPAAAPVQAQTQSLPNTGPGPVLGIFAGTTTVGTVISHFIIKRRAGSIL